MGGIVRYDDESWEGVKEEFSTEIKRRGEEAARRAGYILDVSQDGYYNTKKCIADFEKVNIFIFYFLSSLFYQGIFDKYSFV